VVRFERRASRSVRRRGERVSAQKFTRRAFDHFDQHDPVRVQCSGSSCTSARQRDPGRHVQDADQCRRDPRAVPSLARSRNARPRLDKMLATQSAKTSHLPPGPGVRRSRLGARRALRRRAPDRGDVEPDLAADLSTASMAAASEFDLVDPRDPDVQESWSDA